MTVCIGALATESIDKPCKTVVVASDRMVTMGNFIEFEHEIPKISELTPTSVILVAGDALRGSKIVDTLKTHIHQNNIVYIQKIAETAANIYAQCRDQQIEVEIFRSRGFNRQQFYQQLQQTLHQNIIFQLDQQTISFEYGVEVIIAGVDENGGHLYSIRNPGSSAINYRQIGYHCMGSGGIHAAQSLIGFGHAPNHDLERTLFSVFVAKKRGEVAPGVGKDTDMMIISEKGIHKLVQEDLDALDEIYRAYYKPIEKDTIDKIKQIKVMKDFQK